MYVVLLIYRGALRRRMRRLVRPRVFNNARTASRNRDLAIRAPLNPLLPTPWADSGQCMAATTVGFFLHPPVMPADLLRPISGTTWFHRRFIVSIIATAVMPRKKARALGVISLRSSKSYGRPGKRVRGPLPPD